MKKALALTALAAACSASVGQTMTDNVRVYGLVDIGVNSVSGMKGGTDNSVVSGIMEGSRVGIRGEEEIGRGYRALFRLESRLEADTGNTWNRPASGNQVPDRISSAEALGLPAALDPVVSQVAATLGDQIGVNLRGAFWDRSAYVALVTPVGGFILGHQYTPAYEMVFSFDTLATQSSLSVGQIAAIPAGLEFRASNALQYRIEQGPISASAMYAFGEVPGSDSANRFWGFNAKYEGDLYGIGLGYNERKNELGEKALRSTIFGAKAKAGPGTVGVLVGQIKDDNPAGLSAIGPAVAANPAVIAVFGPGAAAVGAAVQDAFVKALKQDAMLYQIGYKWTTGRNTFYVAYNRFDDKRDSDADVQSYGIVYTYELSKRTDINAVLTRFDNSSNGQAAPGQAGFLGGVTESAGTDSTNVAIGIRHRF
jgi:predicted porin